MKRVVGYIFNFEIYHKSEIDYAKKKRDDYDATPVDLRPKKVPRAPPKGIQFGDTVWHYVESRLHKRFTAKQFIMMYFRYDLRKMDFAHIIAKCDIALENVGLMEHTVCDAIYKSKIDLIKCVKHLFVQFVADVHLNIIKPTGIAKQSLLDYVTKLVNDNMLDLARAQHSESHRFNRKDASIDVEQVQLLWQGGMEAIGSYKGTQTREAVIMEDFIDLLKKANPNFDGTHESASGSIINQQMHLKVWMMWMGKLNERAEVKESNIAKTLIKMFTIFGQIAFGHLASLSTNFPLEREGFES